jgi:lipid-binding SYLF domain-containing protein
MAVSLDANARPKLERKVDAATEVLHQLNRIPENRIPPNLLARAHAVAVIPSMVKLGFVLGGHHGSGVIVVRQADGSWSNPSFIKLSGASVGWQAGAQSTDIILVFKTRKGVDDISRGRLTLGAGASIAAGPVGRDTSAATDAQLKSEIYSYSRSRGLFAGISLQGGVLRMDRKANIRYYDDATSHDTRQIFMSSRMPAPPSAQRFRETLSTTTPSINGPALSRATPQEGPAQVFAIDDAELAPDGVF